MNVIKRFVKGLVIFVIVVITLLYIFDYDYILRGAKIVYFTGHDTAFIDDYTYFDNDTIKKAATSNPWPIHSNYNKTPQTEKLAKVNDDWGTVAFLIIKNDSIWFEHYHEDYNKTSKTNSFSMAKSITTALLGKAIMDGYISSLDQQVSDFYPQYAQSNMTVGDLASMASGLDWVEDYTSPFSVTARANYDDDLEETILNQEVVDTPGKYFKYLSGNTELLGMVIEKATKKTLSNYLSESFWQPMGASDDALWQVDDSEHRLAKAFCCISSNARDFARFGKLYKDYGKWEGKQILDSAYVAKSIRPRFKDGPEYGYGWWLKTQNSKDFFMMRGHLGQYVIVQPEDDVIIVRLGHKKSPDYGHTDAVFTEDISTYIDEAYNMLNND